jgi:signal recognition particle subunit SRP54
VIFDTARLVREIRALVSLACVFGTSMIGNNGTIKWASVTKMGVQGMFEGLSSRLGGVLDGLKKRGALSEADVAAALREVRVALLEADVALEVVKDFIAGVRPRAIGAEVLKSVTPGQQVIKIVHDQLVATLGVTAVPIDLEAPAPVPVLMVGLQGSGKTTTSGKIAKYLTEKNRKKVLVASLDTRRPAAQEQLRVLAEQIGVDSLPIIAGQQPVAIAERAMLVARTEGYDVVVLDTAGRLAIDEELMAELAAVRDAVNPHERLLVVDAMTGQDAVNVAHAFGEQIGVSGVVLTRMDGDARGGAALSMRAVTGQPIKLIGTGEKADALEMFHPERLAGRILGMGDIVSLVEKTAQTLDRDEAEALAERVLREGFNMNDLLSQFRQVRKMGGMSGLMGMLPGVKKMKQQIAESDLDDKVVKRQEAIILSMTEKERTQPDIIKASRKQRIAAGSGTSVPDVNKLIKQWQQMNQVMKQVRKSGGKGLMRGGLGNLLGAFGGGMGAGPQPLPPGMLPPGMGTPSMPAPLGMPPDGGMGGGLGHAFSNRLPGGVGKPGGKRKTKIRR